MDDRKTLRKYNTNLITCGKGVIAFGFWNLLKLTAVILIGMPVFYEAFDTDVPKWAINLLVLIIAILVGGGYFLLHFFIGSSAAAVGKGNKKKRGYLVLAFVFLFFTVLGIPNYFISEKADIERAIIERTPFMIGKNGPPEEMAYDGYDVGYEDEDEDGYGYEDEDEDGYGYEDEDEDEDGYRYEDEDDYGYWYDDDYEDEYEYEDDDPSTHSLSFNSAKLDFNRVYDVSQDSSWVALVSDLVFIAVLLEIIITSFKRKELLKKQER